MMPSFLIIGAQRAGTTSLYSYLLQHPQVLSALAKEIGYFSLHYRTRSFAWYRAHFPLVRRGRRLGQRLITGEASPAYLSHTPAAERAWGRFPGVKLIALLRDPVARAYSHYHHAIEYGYETLSFEDALRAEPERLQAAEHALPDDQEAIRYTRLTYLDRGVYHKHLQRWLNYFPRSNLLVLETERLYEDLPGTMSELFRFLGLEMFDIGRPPRMNVLRYPAIPLDVEGRLREFYRPHNRALSELLGQTFSWDA